MTRPVTDVLRDINAGHFVDEIDEALAEAVGAVRATGKKAEITIKLTLKKAKGHDAVINVEHDLKTKVPEFERPSSVFFATNQNALVSDNPEQRPLAFRKVGGTDAAPAKVVETVDQATGEIKRVGAAA